MNSCAAAGQIDEIESLRASMRHIGLVEDEYTYSPLIHATGVIGEPLRGLEYLQEARKAGSVKDLSRCVEESILACCKQASR